MARASQLAMVLILVYVCVLNILLIHFIWRKYLEPRMSRVAAPRAKVWNTTRPALRERPPPTACLGKGMQAIVITTQVHTDTNDFSARTPVFAELRQALRAHTEVTANVFLVTSTDSFLSSHRAWCNALYTQTQHRVSCQLLLLTTPVKDGDIFTRVLAASPCTTEAVMIPDVVRIRSHDFFSRLENTHPKRVTCLLTETTVGVHCPLPAFRIPRLFLDAYTGETDIETAARGMHVYAGKVDILKLA